MTHGRPLRKKQNTTSFCPKCGDGRNLVVDSRLNAERHKRTRSCGVCQHRWSTIEIEMSEYDDLRAAAESNINMERVVRTAREFKTALDEIVRGR